MSASIVFNNVSWALSNVYTGKAKVSDRYINGPELAKKEGKVSTVVENEGFVVIQNNKGMVSSADIRVGDMLRHYIFTKSTGLYLAGSLIDNYIGIVDENGNGKIDSNETAQAEIIIGYNDYNKDSSKKLYKKIEIVDYALTLPGWMELKGVAPGYTIK